MGETVSMFSPSFNGSVKVEARPERTSSDGGAVLLREGLERSGVMNWLGGVLEDPRNPNLTVHSLTSQLRSVVLQRAQGWEDQADIDVLRQDPVFAIASSDARGTTPLEADRASQPTLSRMFALAARDGNRARLHEGLMRFSGWRLRSENRGRPYRQLTLDVDGLPIEVFGHQPESAYSGYAGARIYSPLIASIAETGDLLDARLRRGNSGSAEDADHWIPQLVHAMRSQRLCRDVLVRMDAGFTGDPTLCALEAEKVRYLGRLRNNRALDRLAEPFLSRPPGRRPHEPREWAHDLIYQANEWDEARRVVLVVQESPDDLFLRHFWLVTNLPPERYSPEAVLARYRRRGKAEAHMGELKSVLSPHLSCTCRGASTVQQVFARNEINLLLSLYAYQVMHTARRILEQRTKEGWSLQRFRERVLKVATTVRVHARQIQIGVAHTAAQYWQLLFHALCRT